MELGEKLKEARLEAGLSQRQLCADVITRNMLSQIEHGTARPSMDTLRQLAERLGRPVSFFLEETACSPNQKAMEAAWEAWEGGSPGQGLEALRDYRGPDRVYDRERELLELLCLLGAAEEALEQGKRLYALELLTRAGERRSPHTRHLERERLVLLAKAGGDPGQLSALLPSLDGELLIRAEAALARKDGLRAGALLDGAEDRTSDRWNLLRGEAYWAMGQYAAAAACYHRAEARFPEETAPLLERYYREQGDYKRAYEYACRQKKQG